MLNPIAVQSVERLSLDFANCQTLANCLVIANFFHNFATTISVTMCVFDSLMYNLKLTLL